MKFSRRTDIGAVDRAKIGLTAIIGAGIYGTVTDIADKYDISRPFVYEQKHIIMNTFSVSTDYGTKSAVKDAEFADKLILAARLCCKASLGGISEALKILELPHSSIGYISGFLNSKASFAVDDLPAPDRPVTVLADEIFACGHPILVILEAESHLILAIELADDRTGATWNSCFTALINKGYQIKKVAKDLGSGLAKGINGLDIIAQADLFHLLMKFDPYLGSLEKRAIGAIEEEERVLNVLKNRKTENAELKAMERYFDIADNTAQKIDSYDNYEFLHRELHIAFNSFENDGTFRNREKLSADIMAALNLMEEEFEGHEGIKNAAIFLKKHITGYFPFIEEVEATLKKHNRFLPEFLVKEICLAYQKNLQSIAVKDYQTAKTLKREADEHINTALTAAKNEQEYTHVTNLMEELGKCIRSSSALEAKNSVLRQYINSFSGQITQDHLNLISFYMNRKVSTRGKYKGLSPVGRMTGTEKEFSFIDALTQ